jgi:hypothetical protein
MQLNPEARHGLTQLTATGDHRKLAGVLLEVYQPMLQAAQSNSTVPAVLERIGHAHLKYLAGEASGQ